MLDARMRRLAARCAWRDVQLARLDAMKRAIEAKDIVSDRSRPDPCCFAS